MEIKGKVHYVGVNDRTKALFENLWPLPYGVSYNSYLIADDDMVALVDTVDVAFFEVYIKKILEAMPQSKKELFFPIVVLPDKKIISYRCYLDGSNLIVAEDPVMCVADFENSF